MYFCSSHLNVIKVYNRNQYTFLMKYTLAINGNYVSVVSSPSIMCVLQRKAHIHMHKFGKTLNILLANKRKLLSYSKLKLAGKYCFYCNLTLQIMFTKSNGKHETKLMLLFQNTIHMSHCHLTSPRQKTFCNFSRYTTGKTAIKAYN